MRLIKSGARFAGLECGYGWMPARFAGLEARKNRRLIKSGARLTKSEAHFWEDAHFCFFCRSRGPQKATLRIPTGAVAQCLPCSMRTPQKRRSRRRLWRSREHIQWAKIFSAPGRHGPAGRPYGMRQTSYRSYASRWRPAAFLSAAASSTACKSGRSQ